MPEILARLSTALADRYTIEHELGAGGMAGSCDLRDWSLRTPRLLASEGRDGYRW